MANINQLRDRLAVMLCQRKDRKKPVKRKMDRAELYMKDRLDGMTCVAIAKKYGVTHQAVSNACRNYNKRMEMREEDGKETN